MNFFTNFLPKIRITNTELFTEEHFATTTDGWQISLQRYSKLKHPSEKVLFGKENLFPVVLCHGMGSNRYAFDLGEERSLARYLANKNLDVWVAELRGHGRSKRINNGMSKHGSKNKEQFQRIKKDPDGWNFDYYLNLDIPSILEYIKKTTNKEKIHWIGHSMGGMIMYAYQSVKNDKSIKSLVSIGSPGSLEFLNKIMVMSMKLNKLFSFLPRTNAAFFTKILSFFTVKIPFGLSDLFWQDLSSKIARLILYFGMDSIERGEQKSFIKILEEGKFASFNNNINYLSNLRNVNTPILAIAGKLDFIASPFNVQRFFDNIGSTDKNFEIFGRANGYSADYGHVDLILGDNSETEVYPFVYNWLLNHSI